MNLTQGIWAKAAAVAVAGGTAFALFGGGAVHTQFSASTQGSARVQGANVGVGLASTNGTGITADNGKGSFVCSSLVPGATPAAPYAPSGFAADPGYCQETITLTNTGSVPETFSIALGGLQVNNNGVNNDATSNLNQLLVTYPDPTNTSSTDPVTGSTGYDTAQFASNGSPGKPAFTTTSDVATLVAGGSVSVPIYLSLEGATSPTGYTLVGTSDANAWNGADITIPFTVTATAGS
jgi:hypothetical protein